MATASQPRNATLPPPPLPTRPLTRQQQVAVAALMDGLTVYNAAARARVGRSTLYRWLKEDDRFLRQLRLYRQDQARMVRSRMEALGTYAVDTIRDLVGNPGVAPAVRLRAALAVLEYCAGKGRPSDAAQPTRSGGLKSPAETRAGEYANEVDLLVYGLAGRPEPEAGDEAPAARESLAGRTDDGSGDHATSTHESLAGRTKPGAGDEAPSAHEGLDGRPVPEAGDNALSAHESLDGQTTPGARDEAPSAHEGLAGRPEPVARAKAASAHEGLAGRPVLGTGDKAPSAQGGRTKPNLTGISSVAEFLREHALHVQGLPEQLRRDHELKYKVVLDAVAERAAEEPAA